MASPAPINTKSKYTKGVEDLPQQFKEFLRVKNPLNHLNAEQKAKMGELRQIVDTWEIHERERKYADEMCLYRFLLGWKWNVKDAAKYLQDCLTFRAKYRPDLITVKHIAPMYSQGWLYEHGYDKEGHPVIYFCLGKDKLSWESNENNEMRFKNVIYVMEEAQRRMPEGIYNSTFIVDLKGANITLKLVKRMKNLFIRLGDVFCESLHRCIVLNSSLTFQTIWGFIKVFLVESTRQKYIFAKAKADKKTLEKYIAPELFPKDANLASGYGKSELDFAADLQDRMRIAAMLHFQAVQSGQADDVKIDVTMDEDEKMTPEEEAALKAAQEEAAAAAELGDAASESVSTSAADE